MKHSLFFLSFPIGSRTNDEKLKFKNVHSTFRGKKWTSTSCFHWIRNQYLLLFTFFLSNSSQKRDSIKEMPGNRAVRTVNSFSTLNFDETKMTFQSIWCNCSVWASFSISVLFSVVKMHSKKTWNTMWCTGFFFPRNSKLAPGQNAIAVLFFHFLQKFEMHRGGFGKWNIHRIGHAWICHEKKRT